MSKRWLTNDRRPLYLIDDPLTRELRYREMFYESQRNARRAEKALARSFLLLRRVMDGDRSAEEEAREWIDELTGGAEP